MATTPGGSDDMSRVLPTPMAAMAAWQAAPALHGDGYLTALQFNVFEDGLTLAPGSVGMTAAFERKLDRLLHRLCYGRACSEGRPFYGFGKTRDMSSLPPVVAIETAARLLGFVDVCYTCLYHGIGGNVELHDAVPPEDGARELLCPQGGGSGSSSLS